MRSNNYQKNYNTGNQHFNNKKKNFNNNNNYTNIKC